MRAFVIKREDGLYYCLDEDQNIYFSHNLVNAWLVEDKSNYLLTNNKHWQEVEIREVEENDE